MTTAATERLSRLTVPDEGELSPELRSFFESTRRREGHVPNWIAAFAIGGDHFARLKDYVLPLLSAGKTGLTLREREIIATVVSVQNRCSYCHTLHVHSLSEVIGDKWLAERIGLDHREVADLSQREHLLAALAIKITNTPSEVGDEDYRALFEEGLSEEDAFEAVQIASIINATNRATLALGVLPDREIFQGR